MLWLQNKCHRLHFNNFIKYHAKYITEVVLMRESLFLIDGVNVA